MSTLMTMAVPCLFGLESVLAYEVKKLGGENVTTNDGRVTFQGDASVLSRANIWLRSGERVCIVLGSFTAVTFQELIDEAEKLPFEDFIGKNDAFPVTGWTLKSQLYSMSSCQSIIKKAAVNRLIKANSTSTLPETGAIHQIRFSAIKDQFTVMLDTTGAGLHKRGYRIEAGEAPIKESLASGIIDLARVRANDTVIDPMCGSGTLLIESAMRAMNIAPGLRRRFAAEEWDLFPQSIWQKERQDALNAINRDVNFKAIGYDIDEDVLKIAQENAKRAGVENCIKFECRDIKDFHTDTNAIVVCNPPYGERLLEDPQVRKLYGAMGRAFKRQPGVSYYIIGPHEDFEKLFGRRADRRRKLYNGMIQCQLYMYFK